MAYNKKTWLARLGQGLNKFIFNGGSKVTLDSAPDVVSQQGTPLSADNMNDLEQRIKSGFDDVDSAINTLNTRVTNIEDTLMGENEVTVQYPDDGNYSSLMPNRVPLRALKFAEVTRFRGKSRAWNQLFNYDTFVTGTINNLNVSKNSGVITISGTASSWYEPMVVSSDKFVNGHKYLLAGFQSSFDGLYWYFGGGAGRAQDAIVEYGNGTVTGNLYLNVPPNKPVNVSFIGNVHDLTLIFGAGNEPSTVADALAQLPALGQYNAYDAGPLVDTEVSGVKSVGVNIWDEEWEVGNISDSDGTNEYASDRIRSKDYIRVAPATDYFFTSSADCHLFFYDINYGYLGYVDKAANISFTTPVNCAFVRFRMYVAYGTTYNHDIQICLNSYADKTTYHPYKTDTLSLPETVTLRGVGTCVETLDLETGVLDDGKFENVDLSTMNFTQYDASSPYYYSSDLVSVIKAPASNNDVANVIASKYVVSSRTAMRASLEISVSNGGVVWVSSGVGVTPTGMLLYEKATYTPSSPIDPITDNFLEVEGGGTIETIQTQTPVIDNCLDVTYDIIPQ